MSDLKIPTARLRRAASRLPRDRQERYAQEWAAEWHAARNPDEKRAVERGAIALATRIWARDVGSRFFGSRGIVSATACWLALLVLLVAAAALGGPVELALAAVAVLALVAVAISGLPTHASHWTIVLGTVVAVGSLVYIFAAINVGVDAADAQQTPPAWTNAVGFAMAGVPLGGVLVVAGATVGVLRERRRTRSIAR